MSITSTFWLTVPSYDNLLVLTIDHKALGLLGTFDSHGHLTLKVAGYHTGKTKWVGEQNLMEIMFERIPESIHSEIIPKIRDALPSELKNNEIRFVNGDYFSNQQMKMDTL